MEPMTKITVKEASRILGVTPEVVRRAVKQKTLPIGFYTKGEREDSFYLYEEKLEAFRDNREQFKELVSTVMTTVLNNLDTIISEVLGACTKKP